MALSETEKAKNKAATLVRNRAYARRKRLLCAAIDAAESAPDVLLARARAEDALAKSEVAFNARDERIEKLRAQIADIEAHIVACTHDPVCADAREAERASWGCWRKMKGAREKEAEGAFPDLAGNALWSAAAWQPPQETLDAMRAARLAVNTG